MKLKLTVTGNRIVLTGAVLRAVRELITLAGESGGEGVSSFEFELDEFSDSSQVSHSEKGEIEKP